MTVEEEHLHKMKSIITSHEDQDTNAHAHAHAQGSPRGYRNEHAQ